MQPRPREELHIKCSNIQYGCCMLGDLTSIMMCAPSSGVCAIQGQANPIVFWTGFSLTATALSIGSVPVFLFLYEQYKKRIREPQVDHVNDNHTDPSSEISTEEFSEVNLYYAHNAIQNNPV